MQKKEIRLDIAQISVYSDRIVLTTIDDNEIISPEEVLEIKSYSKKLMDGKKFGHLIDARKHFSISKDAWNVAIDDKYDQKTIAKAIIVKNPIYFMLGELYISLNKTKVKTEFFTSKNKALKWLEKKVSKK
jgi:hypothetical protein